MYLGGLVALSRLIAAGLKALAYASGGLLLLVTAAWLIGEYRWSAWTPASPKVAFAEGAIGLETFPLKYALVLEQVSGSAFRSGRENGRNLWQAYGFLDNPKTGNDAKPACVANAAEKLPVGFTISRAIPSKAFVTPVAFAGLACAACHSGELRREDGRKTGPIYGMGNQDLDIIGWSDGVRAAVLDPALSAEKILSAYEARCGASDGLPARSERLLERGLIDVWLAGIRDSIGGDLSRYDLPFHGAALKNASDLPAGPGRTRPFRSIVRSALNLPGADNAALSKIPVVFEQELSLRPRSQYDGSIGDPVTRSMVAAFASGASIDALSQPQAVSNIRSAAAYTETLGISDPVPSYSEAFPDKTLDPQRVAEGFGVYQRHCNSCHGNRPPGERSWSLDGATSIHKITPLTAAAGRPAIGTDDARINFRYAGMLPLGIWTDFPGSLLADATVNLTAQQAQLSAAAAKAESEGDLAVAYFWQQQAVTLDLASRKYRLGHPLSFKLDTLSYELGYINNPIPRTYLRAPYLHNASVPTLRQLINLDPRPKVFCRGNNRYDPDAVGYKTEPPAADGNCNDDQAPFRFDTTLRGNSNAGHDYPWRYDDPQRDVTALEKLLEYLKTL